MSTVGTLLDKTSGWLDGPLVTTILLPVLTFGASVGALIATHIGWSDVDHWLNGLTGLRQVLVAGGALAVLLILGWFVEIAMPAVIQAYEGYWPEWLTPLARWGERRQARRRDKLRALRTDSDFARLHREFPPLSEDSEDDWPLLPTRLGNVMLAAECYPNDRYGVDGVFFWPRLYGLLPTALLTPLSTARANLERMLVISLLSALFFLVAVVFAGVGLPIQIWAPCLVGAALLSFLAYRAAVAEAIGYGELIRAAFDTHRRKLLAAIGPKPSTSRESNSWRTLGQVLYRGESDQTDLLHLGSDENQRWIKIAAGAAGLLVGGLLAVFGLKRSPFQRWSRRLPAVRGVGPGRREHHRPWHLR
ncbi:hypothetical protein E6W39_02470 [Kitasatospora acidiphila]|uniref:Uncharacterized protein n=1 Tax=Kitasatospora acidiphila TaxID=2567942 RepID=A0A540VX20_9ACTN|nr:hypothetical protein [Kitasatospora acidiphila]TQF01308.1 hypothetical protein E6W39_02470 [Kitasatospora acidiphila]